MDTNETITAVGIALAIALFLGFCVKLGSGCEDRSSARYHELQMKAIELGYTFCGDEMLKLSPAAEGPDAGQ